MAVPKEPVTLSPEQVEQLHARLVDLRHNVNNHLSLMVAATELIRHKPDAALRLVDSISGPQEKIGQEIKAFSAEFEKVFHITRE